MDYYKIKITSPISVNTKHYELGTKHAKVLEQLGMDCSDPDYNNDEVIAAIHAERNKFVAYSSKKGFYLCSEITANLFSDESLKNDASLRDYMKDKQYELIKVDDYNRIMRYRRE